MGKVKVLEVGDWCFCEFRLRKIERIEAGLIKSVSDGCISFGSFDLNDRCFPLETSIKLISDEFSSIWQEIAATKYPQTAKAHKKLVQLWAECCQVHDEAKLKEARDLLVKIKAASTVLG